MSESPAEVVAAAESDPTPQAIGRAWEAQQPTAQRWFNGFCENWIFAFIVAMALRHFFLEAYRIPTASMEPTLYGDAAVRKADHVVVDKMGFRFTGPNRWGVTVFQYPVPEVQGPHGREINAVTPDGERLDSFPWRPLLQRNFVKRCVAMPDDVFYIAHGDIYLRQEDGSFAAAIKPPHIQEALWLPIYEHGIQDGYVPWSGQGSTVRADGSALVFALNDDAGVLFTQPLRNVYVKPGPVNVRPLQGGSWQALEVSLLAPVFTYQGRTGNLYDLRSWEINRLTTRDLDSARYDSGAGVQLNRLMSDMVGDVRLRLVPEFIEGSQQVIIHQGPASRLSWELNPDSWRVHYNETLLAEGSGSLVGRELQMMMVDNTAQGRLDGVDLWSALPIPAVDPAPLSSQTRIIVRGNGTLRLASCALDRDVHYTADGVMQDQRSLWQQRISAAATGQQVAFLEAQRAQALETRRHFIPALADDALRERLLASMERREQGDHEWLQPLGVSPETAIRVPAGGYLLLGDNSPFSLDSRTWGWVPAANLRGRVLGVVFPRWTRVR